MKKQLLFISIVILISLNGGKVMAQAQNQSSMQLAVKYYSEGNYEKAAPLLKEVLKLPGSRPYFQYYMTCLIELKKFDEAEKEIRRELRGSQFTASELYVQWGYLLKKQGKADEAESKFDQAINSIPDNKSSYVNTAEIFIQKQEYELAKKTYLLAQRKLRSENFGNELARVYYYLRDYDNMLEQYLGLLKNDEQIMLQIEGTISSALSLDFSNELKEKFRTSVLRWMQANPNILAYNRLFIWFLLLEQNYSEALRQSIALDKRTGKEEASIANLAAIAASNRKYEEAKSAFEYLMNKGEKNQYYLYSFMQNLKVSYQEYENGGFQNIDQGNKLAEKFKAGLQFLNYSATSYWLIREYAHLLAFYLKRPIEAIDEINKGLSIRGLNPVEIGELKMELADINVYSSDPWEAIIVYSQIIESNKDNALGDEAKLKKARVSYYLGDFKWAQMQLDVLKASTSKLTANDAMELSLRISNNLNLDTTEIPLRMFAGADLMFFRNEDSLALVTLDSIEKMFPSHTLIDDILFRKAQISIKKGNYQDAVADLEKIVTDFPYETMADDALFLLAETYQFNLNNASKAKELYNQMLLNYPGSIFVADSRKRYRELRGDKIAEEPPAIYQGNQPFMGF